jgi:NAD(P)-dependent dehydrogenase (short-subunit alcohol dehydrogenase family)
MKLEGKVAIVTGGARGMGRAHCITLAAEGADIVTCDVDKDSPLIGYKLGRNEELEETVNQVKALGRRAIGMITDITKEDQVKQLVARTVNEFGKIDILVNNAGVALIGVPTDEVTETQWDLMMNVNLKGPWLCCKAVMPHMKAQKSGKIVNIASHCGIAGFATIAPYNCAKHGVIGLTRTLADELAALGINVNAICPAAVHTPMLEGAFEQIGTTLAEVRKMKASIGAPSVVPNELIPPEYISKLVLFLASDDASFLHGRSILVGSTTALIP